MDLALGKLAEGRRQNYPRAYAIDLRTLTHEQTQQVMDYLLVQGQIVGWNKGNMCVDLKADPSDLARLQPVNGRWRTREEALRDQQSIEKTQVPFYSRHFDALERSGLTRIELIALMQVVNNLNHRKFTFDSLGFTATGGLNFF